jgi:hypothetical protein
VNRCKRAEDVARLTVIYHTDIRDALLKAPVG